MLGAQSLPWFLGFWLGWVVWQYVFYLDKGFRQETDLEVMGEVEIKRLFSFKHADFAVLWDTQANCQVGDLIYKVPGDKRPPCDWNTCIDCCLIQWMRT